MAKKIGFDGRLWGESGVGRYIRNLVRGIEGKELSDDFVIFLTSEYYDKVNFSNPKISKKRADVRWHTLSEQVKFLRILERENFDLVHFPYFSYPIFYKKAFVITIHDLIIDHYPTGIASSLPLPIYRLKHYGYKKIIKNAVKNACKIISPSNATKEELVSLYNADNSKIEVVYEGFDPLIKSSSGNKLVSDNFILYVGNAYPHKNLERLIEAFNKIRSKYDVDLVMIGRKDFFYERLDKNIKGLKVINNVDDSTLFEYYTKARLFVMPSLMEGFGLPVLEAMNLSCPVVSSNSRALKEIGSDGCLYFDPFNVNDMADKISKVLEGKVDLKDQIRKAQSRAQKFSWEKCTNETLKVYESCNSV